MYAYRVLIGVLMGACNPITMLCDPIRSRQPRRQMRSPFHLCPHASPSSPIESSGADGCLQSDAVPRFPLS